MKGILECSLDIVACRVLRAQSCLAVRQGDESPFQSLAAFAPAETAVSDCSCREETRERWGGDGE